MKRFFLICAFIFILSVSAYSSQLLNEAEIAAGLSTLRGSEVQNTDEARLSILLQKALDFYRSVSDYQTMFYKTEKSKGKMGPEEEIFIKFEKDFKIYMKWLNTDKKGVELVYERGKRDGKLAIHKPGLLFGLAQVIFLDQNSPWIKEGSESYNIEDAGIGTFLYDFTQQVIRASAENQLKIEFPEATGENGLSGQIVQVTFLNTKPDSHYMAYRTEVLFDESTGLPVQMKLFDWDQKLMGNYTYKNLKINTGFDDPEFKKRINRYLFKIYRSQE